ncbi:MAG: RdgB/HAM1 family non-canonical purine NTP pyrophosphatase [Caldilinea sp.]|nr:RdgB/HAM1 family non-canonical purine NTP pyrophosphatase [Caldilinea sp.]MDW8440813.1 RdgB/HAM1 family non-canonical purine NTP pyrophosphatase [Caldilineaceae bacterium]
MHELTLLVATHNEGKAREYAHLLGDLPVKIVWLKQVGVKEVAPETGATLVENALLKARFYAAHTNLLTWADDSGLEVDALSGRPGVHSAHYGGEGLTDRERCTLLLRELEGIPMERRTACFRCVVAIARPTGEAWTAEGVVEGVILTAPRGDRGFGYDPIFWAPSLNATLAELPLEVKNRISHRALAAAQARRIVERLLDDSLQP